MASTIINQKCHSDWKTSLNVNKCHAHVSLAKIQKESRDTVFPKRVVKKDCSNKYVGAGADTGFFSKIRSAYERHVRPTWLNLPAGLTQPVGVAHAKGTEDTSAGSNTVLE